VLESNQKSDQGVLGIHHIPAIARNPQRNIDFYSGLMGLRLVKQLKLPQWLEPMRGKLEQLLPPIRTSSERHSNDNRETY
jgi:hypothetical protein